MINKDLLGIPRPARSFLRLYHFDGSMVYGSTYTKVFRWPAFTDTSTNKKEVYGNDIVFQNSAVFGTSILIKTEGIYNISAFFVSSAAGTAVSIIKNNPSNISDLSDPASATNFILCTHTLKDSNTKVSVNATALLYPNDIIVFAEDGGGGIVDGAVLVTKIL